MSRVAILLSAYNGGDYIEKQIISIYQQTYQDFQLYIRDDGSSKEFVQKLRKLKEKYGFELIEGDNVGFVKSFMLLLSLVRDAQFYAFADQDDIWLKDKLKIAVEWFEDGMERGVLSEDIPALFHSAYDVINQEERVVDHFYFQNEGYDFRRSITENHYSGFAMVINCALRDFMLKGQAENIGYHDWWAAMIVQAFGIGYSDDEVMALHRAHGDNVTTFNIRTRLEWLRKSFETESDISKRSKEFKACFYGQLSDKDRKVLDLFTAGGYNLPCALGKCFYGKRWRPVWSSELVVRLLMLIGRI